MIGIAVAATAATIVRIFNDMARVGSGSRNDKAKAPDRSRTPTAEASVIINPITLPRRWLSNWGTSVGADIWSWIGKWIRTREAAALTMEQVVDHSAESFRKA